MKTAFVETNNMIGWTAKFTDTTMLIATQFKPSRGNMQQLDKFNEIWIDNGAYEAGVDNKVNFTKAIQKQLKLANKLSATHKVFIILPDVLLNHHETAIAFYKYIDRIKENIINSTQLVGVIQGTTLSEINSICRMYEDNNIKYIGIPKKMRESINYNVYKHAILDEYKPQYIHYLGFVENDLNDKLLPHIHSIDTKYPIKLALQDTIIPFNDVSYFNKIPMKRYIDYHVERFVAMVSK